MRDPGYTLTKNDDGQYHLSLHYDDGTHKIMEVSEGFVNLLTGDHD